MLRYVHYYITSLVICIIHVFRRSQNIGSVIFKSSLYNFDAIIQVFKTGVTHYFSIERAKRDFGYNPEPKTLDGVVQWFRERGHGYTSSKSSAQKKQSEITAKPKSRMWTFFINFLIAVAIVILVLSCIPVVY